MIISIQFCGGCNPWIDRGRIAMELRELFESAGHRVIYNSPEADFIIYLSGCMSGCAKSASNLPHVTVAGFTVDGDQVPEDGIAREVFRRFSRQGLSDDPSQRRGSSKPDQPLT